jgi:hypothetical protein
MLKLVSIFIISAHAAAPIRELSSVLKLHNSIRLRLAKNTLGIENAKESRDAALSRLDTIDYCVGLPGPLTADTISEDDVVLTKHLMEEMNGKSRLEFCSIIMNTWREVGEERAHSIVSYLYKLFFDVQERDEQAVKAAQELENSLQKVFSEVTTRIDEVFNLLHPEIPDRKQKILLIFENLEQEKQFIQQRLVALKSAINHVFKRSLFPNIASATHSDSKQKQLMVELFQYPPNNPDDHLVPIIARSITNRSCFEGGRRVLLAFADDESIHRNQEISAISVLLDEYSKTL